MSLPTLKNYLTSLADSLREKCKTDCKYIGYEMPDEVCNIKNLGKPIECATAEEMNAVLESATADNVGEIFKFTGTDADGFECDCLYILEEEVV